MCLCVNTGSPHICLCFQYTLNMRTVKEMDASYPWGFMKIYQPRAEDLLTLDPGNTSEKSTSWWAEEYDPSRQRYVDLGSNRVPVLTPCVTIGKTFHTLEAQLNVGVTMCPHRIQRCKCDS